MKGKCECYFVIPFDINLYGLDTATPGLSWHHLTWH